MKKIKRLNEIIENIGSVKDDIEKLACQAGISSDEIRIEKTALEWARNCLIVELHIGRARFERALTPADLGLDDDELQEYIETLYPGKQLLVSGEYKELYKHLDRIESRARRLLDRYGVKTEFGYAVSCIKKNGISPFERMIEKINELETEYRITYERLVEKLDEIRAATEQLLYNASEKIYQSINRDKTALPDEEFKRKFVQKAMSSFPSRAHVESMYAFKLIPKFVPILQARHELDGVKHAALSLRSEIVESIRAGYREQIETFITDVLAHLRQVIYESVSLSLETLRKTGTLPGATVVGLRKMIEQVKQLNFAEDQAVLEQVEKLEKMLDKSTERDSGEVALLLEQLKQENRRFLLALGYKPRVVRSRAGQKISPGKETVTRKKRHIDTQQTQLSFEIEPRRKRAI